MLCFLFCFVFIWWKGEVSNLAATDMACKSGLNWSLKRQYPRVISWKLCTWITQAGPEVVSYNCIPMQIWIMLLKLQVYCSATFQYAFYCSYANIFSGTISETAINGQILAAHFVYLEAFLPLPNSGYEIFLLSDCCEMHHLSLSISIYHLSFSHALFQSLSPDFCCQGAVCNKYTPYPELRWQPAFSQGWVLEECSKKSYTLSN